MQDEEYYTIFTRIGQAKIANAIALGKPMQIKYMAIGDGDGEVYEPDVNQTELRHEVYRAQASSVTVSDAGINQIQVSMLVPANVGGFVIREVGLLDTDGDLIAVSKPPADPKPALGTGAAKDMQYNINITVDNMAAIELKVDPTVIIATKAELISAKSEMQGYTDDAAATAVRTAKEESKAYTDAQVTEIRQTVGSGLVVYAGPAAPTTELTDYIWMQTLNSRQIDETDTVMLSTSLETASGYHLEADNQREHIDNALSSNQAQQAKAGDIIIMEV